MRIGWEFPENRGGIAAGFNDSAIDHFKGQRLSSLVREILQNSLDARASEKKPVRVWFDHQQLYTTSVPEVTNLKQSLIAARETAKSQNLKNAVHFYDEALKEMNKPKITFLCIHDENTKGLTGPVEGPNGSWFALTKGAGLSQKMSKRALGSFGHGSKAPFTMSRLRSIFYFTKFSDAGDTERRFQGKSILQSHRSVRTDQLTQGTGFYGRPDGCLPIIGEQIPCWAIKFRDDCCREFGTSIYIPGTFYEPELFPETAITTLANFYFAIREGQLEVVVGNEYHLKADTVEKSYRELKGRFSEEQDEIDANYVAECFRSVETIIEPDESGEQEIPNFGLVKWFMRIGGDIQWRKVAIARQNGMLITRRPPQLIRFSNVKPFDFFVCVLGQEGSGLLRQIENPQHDNFEFERIDNILERGKVENGYSTFSRKIREIIERYAQLEIQDEVVVNELVDLFGEISDSERTPRSSQDRSRKMEISLGNYNFRNSIGRRRESESGDEGNDNSFGVGAEGMQGGLGEKKTQGGDIPSETGTTKIKGGATSSDVMPKGKKYYLRNLRLRSPESATDKAIIYFDAPDTGTFVLTLFRSGEVGNDPVDIILEDGQRTRSIVVEIIEGKRESVSLKLDDNNLVPALEAKIDEFSR